MRVAAIALALAAAGCAATPRNDPMDAAASLAAAETAFAAHSVREDMRAAFMAHFAHDGVLVRNGWVVSTPYLAGQPAPPIVLDWRPVYTEVARSGELGLSTGPWRITSREQPDRPPAFGQFVSVWRRSSATQWLVAVDLGIAHPQPWLWDAKLETRAAPGNPQLPRAGIDAAEERFAAVARAKGLRAAFEQVAAQDLRFLRAGMQPVAGKAAALSCAAMSDERLTWAIERIETARSGDFGYARGSYASVSDPARPLGWFLRVWRAEGGEWRVILDITNPAPKP